MYHIGELRQAAYCPRQKYYGEQENEGDGYDDVYTAVAELAYHYPELVEDPRGTVEKATELTEVESQRLLEEFDVSIASASLRNLRDTRPDVWTDVTEPLRENLYIQMDSLHGTVDKVVRDGDRYRASLVKSGSPPDRGVWPSQRVEAAGAHRLLVTQYPVRDDIYVEYPVEGEIRSIEIQEDDRERVDKVLETLEEIERDVTPRRTRHRGRCRSCSYRERCGVDSPAVALKQLGGLPSKSDVEEFGESVADRFTGLFD